MTAINSSDQQLDIDRLQWGTIRDWAQLVRLPNVFTLFSDCIAAAIVAGSLLVPVTAFLPAVVASLFAYWAGMILNDVVDIEEDREHRPDRPLASDRISSVVAGHVATGMLMLAPILILATCSLHTSEPLWLGAAFLASVLLSLCVRAYDSPLKQTPLGPLLMGTCRSLNILMVGCTMLAVSPAETSLFPKPLLFLAIGIGIYIMGITIYAHREEGDSSPAGLILGMIFQTVGLAIIAGLPYWAEGTPTWQLNPRTFYPLLIGLIGLTVLNRGYQGVIHPVSRKVQLAVKHAILTLILIDAGVVLMWAGAWYGVAVVLLLLPALSSAIRFRST